MAEKITDALVKALTPPGAGNRIVYDNEVSGFGVRITAGGAVSFVLNYRFQGRERRLTIGPYGPNDLTVAAARKRAGGLRDRIRSGEDPLAERIEAREAPTVAELCTRFEKEHLPKKRDSTAVQYRQIIKADILPTFGARKVASITYTDIDALHRKVTTDREAPYRANRVVALLSKMFALAIRWHMRTDNPAKGIERNVETARRRYLKPDELDRLTKALVEFPDQQAVAIVRLCMLTGARSGEVMSAKWADLDLGAGLWSKPAASTKQNENHQVPLSAPALQVLADLRKAASKDAEFVFPGERRDHRADIHHQWKAMLKAAKIENLRIHDLRHSYASFLANGGATLLDIGALLGHSQPSTTARYAHLFNDRLRAATDRVGAIVTGGKSADVVQLKGNTR